MRDIDVLWLDDDIPSESDQTWANLENKFSRINLFPVRSCAQAEKQLQTRGTPRWAIIDLVVPQCGWGDKFYQAAGIEYIKYLKTKFQNEMKVFAFGVMVTEELRNHIKMLGAEEAFVKSNISFESVLRKIEEETPAS